LILNAGQILGFGSTQDLAVMEADIRRQVDWEVNDWTATQ